MKAFPPFVVFTSLLCSSAGFAAQQGANAVNQAAAYQNTPFTVGIAYTGRLLGYMRGTNPGQEQCPDVGGPNIDLTEPDTGAIDIPCTLKILGKNNIIVGTGDNLAPAYWARFLNKNAAKKITHTTIPTLDHGVFTDDSVALFLQRAQYDALVPGKEDFYFGTYHLMNLGRLLQKDGHLVMLGDNLFLQQTTDSKYLREPESSSDKELNYASEREGIAAKFKGEATPWLVSLKFDLDLQAAQAVTGGKLCRAETQHPDRVSSTCEPWDFWQLDDKTANWQKGARPPSGTSQSVQFIRDLAQGDFIISGTYFFCLDGGLPTKSSSKRQDTLRFCQPLQVLEPMLCKHNCELDKNQQRTYEPYIIPASNNNVAIFGVVDENLQSYLARQNASWEPADGKRCNVGKHCRTSIHVIPPDAALQQALEFFYLKNPAFIGIKVLLAQLAQANATELASMVQDPLTSKDSALRCVGVAGCPTIDTRGAFEAIISKADQDHATPEITLKVTVRGAKARRPVVFVPRDIWDKEDKNTINSVNLLTISRNGDDVTFSNHLCGSTDAPCKKLNTPRRASVGSLNPRTTLLEALEVYDIRWNHAKPWATKPYPNLKSKAVQAVFKQLALESVMEFRKNVTCPTTADISSAQEVNCMPGRADAVLLQQRDFFFDTAQTPDVAVESVQELVDRILWKDDLLAEVNLTGAQIRGLLKQSDKYDLEENDASAILSDTRGRALVKAGLVLKANKNPANDSDMYVQNDDFDDSDVYSVVTSNHIAGGEGGYPDAAKQATGEPDETVSFVPLSDIVCNAVQDIRNLPLGCRPLDLTTASKNYRIEASTHDDVLTLPMPSFKGKWDKVEEGIHDTFASPPDPYKGAVAEKRLEQYPILQINVDKLGVGYSLSAAAVTNAHLKQFAGITNTDISQPSSSKLDFDQHTRLLYRLRRPFDFGFEDTLAYTRQRQDSLTSPTTTSWPRNTFTIGPVVQLRGFRPWSADPCKPLLIEAADGGRGEDESAREKRCSQRTFNSKYAPHFFYVIHPSDFTIQPSNTVFPLVGAPATVGGTPSTLSVFQSRAYSWTPKIGARFERNKDSYIEAGYQWQFNRNVPTSLTVAGSPPCLLSSTTPLATCFSTVVLTGLTAQVGYQSILQEGFYWNGKATVPLGKTLSYAMDSRGDFFRDAMQGNSALARYDIVWGHSAVIPLIGNFSLQPRFEFVFYENKIVEDDLLRRNFTMTLNYAFRRDTRVGIWPMMKYKAAAANPGAGK